MGVQPPPSAVVPALNTRIGDPQRQKRSGWRRIALAKP